MTPEQIAALAGEESVNALSTPGYETAQGGLDRGEPWEATSLKLISQGVDPKSWEDTFKYQRARQEAVNVPQGRADRVAEFLPGVSTLKTMVTNQQYNDARKNREAGRASDEDYRQIAKFEEEQARKRSMSTGRTVLEAAGKVPSLIAEFGVAGAALGPLGIGAKAAEGASLASKAAQFTGRSAVTGAVVPSMAPAIASQRSVESNTPIYELRNVAPAVALGTLNTMVLGRLQNAKRMAGVPTFLGRNVAKGAVGSVEAAGVDTVGSVVDSALGESMKGYKLGTKWGGLIRSAVNGEEGAGKELLAQVVSFSLFAAAHGKPAKPGEPVVNSPAPVEAAKEFINAGGKPEEAVTINSRFMKMLEEDPANAMERAREMWQEEKGDYAQRYAKAIGEAVAKRFEVIGDSKNAEPDMPGLDREALSLMKPGEARAERPATTGESVPEMVARLKEKDRLQGYEDQRLKADADRQAFMERMNTPDVTDARVNEMERQRQDAAREQLVREGIDPDEARQDWRADAETVAEVDRRWKGTGMDPIESWPEADVRGFAKELGIKGNDPKALREAIMDAFVEEQAALDPFPTPERGVFPPTPNARWGKPGITPQGGPPAQIAPDAPQRPQKAQGLFDRPAAEAPPTAPPEPAAAPPRVPAPRKVNLDALRAKQQGKADKAAPLVNSPAPPAPPRPAEPTQPVTPQAPQKTQRQVLMESGFSEKDAAFIESDPNSVMAQMAKAGLDARQAHVLTEHLRGRSLEDIANDPIFLTTKKKNGKKITEGVTRQTTSRLGKEAREKFTEQELEDLKSLIQREREVAAPGEVVSSKMKVHPSERIQDKAMDIYTNLPAELRSEVDANPEVYIDKATGRWKYRALKELAGDVTPLTRTGGVGPKTVEARHTRHLQEAVRQARRSPTAESLSKLDAAEKTLRAYLEQQGDKTPGATIKAKVPKYEKTRRLVEKLQDPKQGAKESDFRYQERLRRQTGAKTLFEEVLNDVKRSGMIRMGAVGRGEVQAIIEGNADLAKIFSTDPNQKGGLHADEYIPPLLKKLGIEQTTMDVVEPFVKALNDHALVEQGKWAERLEEKRRAEQELQDGVVNSPAAEKKDPWDEDAGLFERFNADDEGAIKFAPTADDLRRAGIISAPHVRDPLWKPSAAPSDMPMRLPPLHAAEAMAHNQTGSRNQDPSSVAITTYKFDEAVGKSLANVYMTEKFGTQKNPFPMGKDQLTELADGSRKPFADVIEAEMNSPGSQPLTPEQRAFLDQWKAIREWGVNYAMDNGVKFYDANGKERSRQDILSEGYFHRVAEKPSELVDSFLGLVSPIFGSPKAPGKKQGFSMEREHDTMADGIAKKVKYMDAYDSTKDFLDSVYRAVAGQRLRNNPLLGGKDIVLREYLKLMERNKDHFAKIPRGGRQAFRDAMMGDARLLAKKSGDIVGLGPAFEGMTYAPDVQRNIERMFGKSDQVSKGVRFGNALMQEFRQALLALDLSTIGLQQRTVFRYPGVMAEVLKEIPKSFMNERSYAEWVAKDPARGQAMREAASSGVTFGNAGADLPNLGNKKSFIERLTYKGWGPGALYTRSGRVMSNMFDQAKTMMWMVAKPTDPREWSRFGQAMENSMGLGRMEQLGMSPGRILAERILFLAPSYYRANYQTLRQAAEQGRTGEFTRRHLSFLAGSVVLTGVGILYALKEFGDISQDEFEERLNPARGKFMMIPVDVGQGKKVEFGLGGFLSSVIRTAAKTAEEPGVGHAAKWWQGHAGVAPRLALQLATGKDYMDRPVSPGMAVATSAIPLGVQQLTMGDGTGRQRVAQAAASFFGFRSFPGFERDDYVDRVRQKAKEQTGKEYSQLTIPEQAKAVRAAGPREKGQRSPEESARITAMAAANDAKKVESMTGKLSKDSRSILEEFRHPLPAYDIDFSYNGVMVPLDKNRQKVYEGFLVEEYDKALSRASRPRLAAMKPDAREKYLKGILTDAKEKARSRLLRAK